MLSRLLSGAGLLALASAASAAPAHADITLVEGSETSPSLNVFGRLQYDFAHYDSDTRGSDEGVEMRRFRLGLDGEAGAVFYKLEGDFSQGQARLADAFVGLEAGPVTLRAGQFKTPNSLEELTSSGSVLFMERGQTNTLFGLGRRVGVMAEHSGEGYALQGGVFGNVVKDDISTALDGSETSLAARAVWQPVRGEAGTLHLAAHVRATDYEDGKRFSTKPASREFGPIARLDYRAGSALGEADDSRLAGIEALWLSGRFLAQGEIMQLDIDGPAGDPSITSGYGVLGFMLTDDARGYKASRGALGGVEPNRPVTEGGIGAWQASLRAEFTDFDTAPAGELSTYAAGLSWWPTAATRVMLEAGSSTLDGALGDTDLDFMQVRLQLDW